MTGETISYRSHEPTLRVSTLQLLDRHHIDYSRWGLGGSKTVDQLIEELQQRESVLELGDDGELVRRVDGVGVDVFATVAGQRYRLVEDRQEYSIDGTARQRNFSTSLGEKMRAGEEPLDVMVRALQEELSIDVDASAFHVGDTTRARVPSEAFPGLVTDRGLTYGAVMVDESDFVPSGYSEVQPTKTVYFVWEPVDIGMVHH